MSRAPSSPNDITRRERLEEPRLALHHLLGARHTGGRQRAEAQLVLGQRERSCDAIAPGGAGYVGLLEVEHDVRDGLVVAELDRLTDELDECPLVPAELDDGSSIGAGGYLSSMSSMR